MAKKETPKQWTKTKNDIFESFAVELQELADAEQTPPSADQDVRYVLELQQKRLRSKGLKVKYKITPRGLLNGKEDTLKRWSDKRYTNELKCRTCHLDNEIYKNGKKIYNKEQNSNFYQIVTDLKAGVPSDDEPYVCPNCGAVNTVRELQQGCKFCRTRFNMDDLYPKVSNYFFIKDQSGTKKELKNHIFAFVIPCILLFLFGIGWYRMSSGELDFSADWEELLPPLISTVVGGIIGGFVFGYILWAIFKLGSLFMQAGKSTGMLVQTAGSSNRFVAEMQAHSPEFTYEYFAAKVVSLVKMIIFSENAQELPNYEGPALGNRFHNIVDTFYTGAVALKDFQTQGDFAYIKVYVYLDNLFCNNKSISRQTDRFTVYLRKNIAKPIDFGFSVKKIQCKTCFGSFDATKEKACPYCGNKYDISDDEWIVTGIE